MSQDMEETEGLVKLEQKAKPVDPRKVLRSVLKKHPQLKAFTGGKKALRRLISQAKAKAKETSE